MEQKPTINSIKKCKQDSRTLSLQETDNEIGVEANCCSTFLKSSGLLAQGECWNGKSKERNALIKFRDPNTGKLKGRNFRLFSLLVAVFVDNFL